MNKNRPPENPRYRAAGPKRGRRAKGFRPFAIALVVLVCACFLVLCYLLLNNKKQEGTATSSGTDFVSSAGGVGTSSAQTPVSSDEGASSAPTSSSGGGVSSRATSSSNGGTSSRATSSSNGGASSTVVSSGHGGGTGVVAPYAFFDDAIFIGDSITNQLSQYTTRMRSSQPDFLGKARFGGVGSYSVFNALQPVTATDNKGNPLPHHLLNGVRMQTQDYIYARNKERPVNKAFIMFGTNDLNMYKDVPSYLKAYKQYIDRITEKNPQLTIYLMTTTPVTKTYATTHKGKLNPNGIDDYNRQLKTFCQQNGYLFVDTNTSLRDENGYLPDNWASADGFHPNSAGFARIVTAVREQVGRS